MYINMFYYFPLWKMHRKNNFISVLGKRKKLKCALTKCRFTKKKDNRISKVDNSLNKI